MDATRGRLAERPREIPARGWKDVLVRTLREIKADKIPMVAAASAFYAWLALLPAIIAAITMYSLLASPQTVAHQVQQLTKSLSAEAQKVLSQPITQATSASSKGLGIGLIVSLLAVLWSASGGVNGLIQGINIAYDEQDERKFLKKRGLAILLTLGAIVAFLVVIALVVAFPKVLDHLGLGAAARVAAQVARWALLMLIMVFGLSVLYRWAPDRDNPRFRWVTWGSVVATVLWLVVSAVFSFYVSHFGNYNKTYGALAGVIILEFWLYLTCLIILFGAELNSELEAQTARDTTVGPDRPMGQRGAVKADVLGEETGKGR